MYLSIMYEREYQMTRIFFNLIKGIGLEPFAAIEVLLDRISLRFSTYDFN